jgi:hypothetical protein
VKDNSMKYFVAVLFAVSASTGTLRADETDSSPGPEPVAPHYSPMPFETAREWTFAWAAAATQSETAPEVVQQTWANVEAGIPARGIHELVVRSFAAIDPSAAELFAKLDPRDPPLVPPEPAPLMENGNEFYAANLRLHVARLLTDLRMYDEAHALFEEVDLTQAVDPATALFYRAVCEHQLLMKDEGLATMAALLERTEAVPESYVSVARLMQAELEALEPETLDEIAGLMRDVERRLDLARGGQRVQKKEDEIAAKLDEMIKKIEEQMSQSSSSGAGGGGGQNQPGSPLGESTVKGSTAPGEVDSKNVRREGGWGDLPPREREQAKNEIEKAFPSNYSRLINEYFLKRTRSDRPANE